MLIIICWIFFIMIVLMLITKVLQAVNALIAGISMAVKKHKDKNADVSKENEIIDQFTNPKKNNK